MSSWQLQLLDLNLTNVLSGSRSLFGKEASVDEIFFILHLFTLFYVTLLNWILQIIFHARIH